MSGVGHCPVTLKPPDRGRLCCDREPDHTGDHYDSQIGAWWPSVSGTGVYPVRYDDPPSTGLLEALTAYLLAHSRAMTPEEQAEFDAMGRADVRPLTRPLTKVSSG